MSSQPPQGQKKALLIAIDYLDTKDLGLQSSNDVVKWKELLIEVAGWKEADIVHMSETSDGKLTGPLRDKSDPLYPTMNHILAQMDEFSNDVQKGDVLFFVFCGHGLQVDDHDNSEEDGSDECLVPRDFCDDSHKFNYTHLISDDVLRQKLVEPLPEGSRLTAVFDCCHSGDFRII
eukprot:gene255-249_t